MKALVLKLNFKDENYAKALGVAFANFYRNFILAAGDGPGNYLKHGTDGNEPGCGTDHYDLLLTDDYDLFCKEVYKAEAWRTVYFYDDIMHHESINCQGSAIYKYSNIHDISERLIRIYTDNTGIKLYDGREEGFKKYVFAGCGGGVGTTAVALTLCRVLSLYQGKKVLFLDFQAFSNEFLGGHGQASDQALDQTSDQASATSRGHSYADYEYYFMKYGSQQKNETKGRSICRDEYGVYFFCEPYGINTCRLAKNGGFDGVLNEIRQRYGFDYIIADIGADFSPEVLKKMDGADGIVLVHKKAYNRKRRDVISRYIKLCDVNFERQYDIVNFADVQADELPSADYFSVCEDGYSFIQNQTGNIEINHDRSFGIAVSEFARLLAV